MSNNQYLVSEVSTKQLSDKFIYGINHIYTNHKNWISPLDMDIRNIFNSEKNKKFKNGDAKRWIIEDNSGKVIGRIAGFYNTEKKNKEESEVGGIGFYECIDESYVSKLLFDTAINWLKKEGFKAVDGPINFGENYNYWGLLQEGRIEQTFGMQYHPEYYIKQFEDYGFNIYYNQFSYRMNPNNFSEQYLRIGKMVGKRNNLTAKHLNYSKLSSFSNDMAEAFNVIWSSFKKDYSPIDGYDLEKEFKSNKLFIDPKLIWVIYSNNKPVAMAIMMPDLNQIVKEINGKTSILNIIKLLYLKFTHKINRIRALVIGVSPEFQKKGVEAFIFHSIWEVLDRDKYTDIEFSWIGDFNPKMLNTIEKMGPEKTSTHSTYRLYFDKNKKFERYPIG